MAFCPKLQKGFQALAGSLALSKDYIRAGKAASTSIFHFLTENSRIGGIKIARCRRVGSVEKGTAIRFENAEGKEIQSDFDCVVYINDVKPPFPGILETFEQMLEKHPQVSKVSKKRRALEIWYESDVGRIHLDLVPAPNFVKNKTVANEVGLVQTTNALNTILAEQVKYIRLDKEISQHVNKLYSSSCAEEMVTFVKNQVKSEFMLNVVQLAKYWTSQIDFKGESMPAKSYVTELIAISAQKGKRNKRCVVFGFCRFLNQMRKLHSLVLSFSGKIPAEYSKQESPVVIDPINPFENLVDGISKSVIRVLETQAKRTLQLLEKMRRANNYEGLENAIDEIFRHKP